MGASAASAPAAFPAARRRRPRRRLRLRPRGHLLHLLPWRRASRGRASSGAATSRPRSASPSTRPCTARRSPSRSRPPGPCPTCHGSGAKPGTSPRTCPRCEGTGIDAQSQGLFSISQPCPECGGQGEIIDDPCPTCGGQGITQETKRYRVNIPAGVHDGSRIRLAGKGEAGYRGGPRGDLYVTTRVAPSPVFKQRPDGNLEVDLPVTVAEAIQGATIEVPTLNGSKTIRIPAGNAARLRPATARRGAAQDQGLGPRRHLLPDPHRRPQGALRRAARGGREAGRGAQRAEPACVPPRGSAGQSGAEGRVRTDG